jgi:hypothetical protein
MYNISIIAFVYVAILLFFQHIFDVASRLMYGGGSMNPNNIMVENMS